jgi:hypothetical protein
MEGIEVEGLELQEAYFRGRKLHGTAIPFQFHRGILVCDSFFLYTCFATFKCLLFYFLLGFVYEWWKKIVEFGVFLY